MTTFGQVLKLVAQARRRKARVEKMADRLARYFLPVVEAGRRSRRFLIGYLAGWPDVWSRMVAVLVVACPCGLVLATPAAMLASMAWLARHGVLIKGGSAVESLAKCDTFAFDKTGTLTKGVPQFTSLVVTGGRSADEVLRLAASAEAASRHPLALAVIEEARRRSLPLFEAARRHPPSRRGCPGRVHSRRRGRPPPGHGRQPAFARRIRDRARSGRRGDPGRA